MHSSRRRMRQSITRLLFIFVNPIEPRKILFDWTLRNRSIGQAWLTEMILFGIFSSGNVKLRSATSIILLTNYSTSKSSKSREPTATIYLDALQDIITMVVCAFVATFADLICQSHLQISFKLCNYGVIRTRVWNLVCVVHHIPTLLYCRQCTCKYIVSAGPGFYNYFGDDQWYNASVM